MADFEVRPKHVALAGNQAQDFEAVRSGQPVPSVKWSIRPTRGSGTIDPDSGLYSSPRFVLIRRKAYVQATEGGPPAAQAAMATVELTSIEIWTQLLGAYWILCCFVLLVALLGLWHVLCPTCRLKVSPPIVTLAAAQPQMFTANTEVTWSSGVQPSGLYTASDPIEADQRLVVTATSSADAKRSVGADVFLSSDLGLYVHPQNAEVLSGCDDRDSRGHKGQISDAGCSVTLVASISEAPKRHPRPAPGEPGSTGGQPAPASGETSPSAAPRIEWLQPTLGRIERVDDQTASFHAENVRLLGKPETILVIARIKDKMSRLAGTWITILPRKSWLGLLGSKADDCASDMFGILSLIAIMGALGGTIHGISSFTAFVGNRELKMSWVWWYFLKPFLGGAVALVVFLVFRSGFGGSDFSLGSADCLKVAALAGLIGLFAEPATLKLKDIFETLFTTKGQAARRDALGTVSLRLDSLDPETVAAHPDQTQSVLLRILGSGFTSRSQVKIGDASPRKPAQWTATQLDVSLAPEELKAAHDLPVVVINDGQSSNALVLRVT